MAIKLPLTFAFIIILGWACSPAGRETDNMQAEILRNIEPAPDAVVPAGMELYPTWNSVGIQISYSGDDNKNTDALLFWRHKDEQVWRNGLEMTIDRERRLIWASIYPLESGASIETRVYFTDPAADNLEPLQASTRTRELPVETSGGRDIFVSPSGDDSAEGTRGQPFKTLGRAVRNAKPGDCIRVYNGVYTEGDLASGLKGSAEKPIVIAAAHGSGPILDGSIEIRKNTGTWEVFKKDVWVTTLPLSITGGDSTEFGYVAQDGARMFRYGSLDDLLADRPGVPRAWYYDRPSGKLYVRTGTPGPAGMYNYRVARYPTAFRLSGSEYLVIRGFEMRYYGQAAVLMDNGANNCILAENTIHNAPNGVYLDGVDTRDNAIWHNLVYEPGLSTIPWSSIKASGYPRQGIFIGVAGRGNSCNYNTVHGWFDGICVEGWKHEDDLRVNRDTDVMFNHIYNIGDDAFELDGGGVNLRLHGNSIRNALVAISLAPVERGPVYVTRNDATYLSLMFKLNVGCCESLGPTFVYHNSGYGLNRDNGFAMIGLTGPASGGVDTRNKVFANNAIIGADKAVRTGYDGNILDYNCYWHTPGKWLRPFEWNGVLYETIGEFSAATGQEAHGIYADPLFRNTLGMGEIPWKGFGYDQIGNYPLVASATTGDLHLNPASPLIDRGAIIRGFNEEFSGKGPDIGAFEYQQ
jgi:Protein of unknown function (DUF1565)